jgi:hypothetical protein
LREITRHKILLFRWYLNNRQRQETYMSCISIVTSILKRRQTCNTNFDLMWFDGQNNEHLNIGTIWNSFVSICYISLGVLSKSYDMTKSQVWITVIQLAVIVMPVKTTIQILGHSLKKQNLTEINSHRLSFWPMITHTFEVQNMKKLKWF